jgi:hypothetical protein
VLLLGQAYENQINQKDVEGLNLSSYATNIFAFRALGNFPEAAVMRLWEYFRAVFSKKNSHVNQMPALIHGVAIEQHQAMRLFGTIRIICISRALWKPSV